MPHKAVGLGEQSALDFGIQESANVSLVLYYPLPLQQCWLVKRLAEVKGPTNKTQISNLSFPLPPLSPTR